MNKQKNKVFVAMSGGVDSSVAAALLKKRGFAVVGCYIKCYNLDGCAERDVEDARRVAEQLGIPFYVFDLEEEYKKRVIDYMIAEYAAGRTPNPDVICNKEIKFGLFLRRALELGANYIATGHYVKLKRKSIALREPERADRLGGFAIIRPEAGKTRSRASDSEPACRQAETAAGAAERVRGSNTFSLNTAKDQNKDQSYFLWTLTQNQLRHCLFPIGEYTKPEVRAMAKKWGLITAAKKDSQGICFLGKVTLADFLGQYLPEKRGAVLDTAGRGVGEHRGAQFYTIGQRHGLGIGGFSAPLYVADKNPATNTLIVAKGENDPALYRKEIGLNQINFINTGEVALVRIRYRQPLAKASLVNNKIIFERPQRFVAPGQSAVFYSSAGELLGGGIIR